MNHFAERRVARVTGAGSGIGRATALAFSAADYSVAFVDRDFIAVEREAAAFGSRAIAIGCDVTDEVQVAHAVTSTVDAFGGLHAAFNAADIDGDAGPLADSNLRI